MNELGNTPADKDYKPSGISRAEEAARKKYPIYLAKAVMSDGSTIEFDAGETTRNVFKLGYEQAEKDLSLTWEDLELLHRLFAEEEDNFSKHDKYFYAEALTRFKQFKED